MTTKITTNIIADNAITLDKIDTSSVAVTSWDTAYGWGDHSAQNYATQNYVDLAVSDLVDSSPAALDTLNELASALNDDANFATTVNNAIASNTTEIDNAKAEAVAFAIALG